MSNLHKDIKRLVCEKLEKIYPNFKGLSKKRKKQVAQMLLEDVYANYDMNKAIEADKYELCHVEPIPENIYNLDQIKALHDNFNGGMLAFKLKSNARAIKDPELLAIDKMVNWPFVNHLLAPDNYFAAGHKIFPVQLFKAELLKSLKYPELSYRKFCDKEINNNKRKENRAFIGLKLTQKIDHSQLSQFRSGLPFNKLINVMVYFIHLFLKEKPLSESTFYAVDSTELAERISNFPLAKLKVGDLLKHREGLEPLRTLSQKTSTTVATIANIATLLIEIAVYRKKKKKPKNRPRQMNL